MSVVKSVEYGECGSNSIPTPWGLAVVARLNLYHNNRIKIIHTATRFSSSEKSTKEKSFSVIFLANVEPKKIYSLSDHKLTKTQ